MPTYPCRSWTLLDRPVPGGGREGGGGSIEPPKTVLTRTAQLLHVAHVCVATCTTEDR